MIIGLRWHNGGCPTYKNMVWGNCDNVRSTRVSRLLFTPRSPSWYYSEVLSEGRSNVASQTGTDFVVTEFIISTCKSVLRPAFWNEEHSADQIYCIMWSLSISFRPSGVLGYNSTEPQRRPLCVGTLAILACRQLLIARLWWFHTATLHGLNRFRTSWKNRIASPVEVCRRFVKGG
jgi:hypothetical protein